MCVRFLGPEAGTPMEDRIPAPPLDAPPKPLVVEVVEEAGSLRGLCFFIMVVFSCSAAKRIFSSRVSEEDGFVGVEPGEEIFDEGAK